MRFWVSVFGFCFLFSASAYSSPPIRLALLKNVRAVTVEGEELRIQIDEPKPVSTYLASPAKISPAKEGIKVNDDFYPMAVHIFSLEDKISLNGKPLAGELEIRRDGDHLLVINQLPLEEYLVGLIHGEINANWPVETIKAQAVAARTYALYRQQKRKSQPYDLESDVLDQVYAGPQGEKDRAVQKAIEATQGEVLWFLGYYPAYFHSCCGGETETAGHVWNNKEASQSVVDPFCANSPYAHWEFSLPAHEFLRSLKGHGLEGGQLRSITAERFENAPRNALVTVETDKRTLFISPTDLRKILGYQNLKSTWFNVSTSPRMVIFKGTGYGHGVGLCQWGAKAMADAGKTYREILQFYYPKAAVRKIY